MSMYASLWSSHITPINPDPLSLSLILFSLSLVSLYFSVLFKCHIRTYISLHGLVISHILALRVFLEVEYVRSRKAE